MQSPGVVHTYELKLLLFNSILNFISPNISLGRGLGIDKPRSKSRKESPECSKQFESDHNKSEGSVRDTAQSKESPEEQVLTTPQVKFPPPLIHLPKPVRTELDKEWETFNELINT